MIKLSKKDILWGYFAQFFSIASGIITLPLILSMLSAQEIGMNYLMLTVGSLVSLFDFGFAPQFGRSITYIFSGAQKLKKEGVEVIDQGSEINYHLLATMIHTARFIYRRLAIIVLLIMITLGSLYIYKVTKGFTNINNSFIIWIVYSISTFFNIYYSYYTSLLTGKGLIMESRKATVYSRVAYIILTFAFLFSGLGLLGVALANLVAPFVNRYIAHFFFFTTELNKKIYAFKISNQEKIDLFRTIWHNARKLGLVFIGSYAINRLSMFLAGLYLSLSEIASYGLMLQLVGLIVAVSSTLFGIYQPRFSALRIEGNTKSLIKDFAFTMNVYYLLYFLGISFLIIIGPWMLTIIGSNAVLPSLGILSIFAIIALLEGNHSNFATFIITKNNIPFVESSLIAGGCIALGSYFSLAYTNLSILGLILVQGLTQLFYANWKWPYVVFKEFNLRFKPFMTLGMVESIYRFKVYFRDR
jgi:O-antigen/teichoic acid export membrane protein